MLLHASCFLQLSSCGVLSLPGHQANTLAGCSTRLPSSMLQQQLHLHCSAVLASKSSTPMQANLPTGNAM